MACGNDGWLAGMRWDEGYGVFLWRNSSIPLLAALASPFAVRRGVVGAVLGGFRVFLARCAWLARCLLSRGEGEVSLPSPWRGSMSDAGRGSFYDRRRPGARSIARRTRGVPPMALIIRVMVRCRLGRRGFLRRSSLGGRGPCRWRIGTLLGLASRLWLRVGRGG